MSDRPTVNVYEGDPEELVCRPMSDGEFAVWQTDQAAAVAAVEAHVDAAWVELRMKRDRWLAQTDAFFINPLPSDFPADKAAAIAANADAWKTFRQQLRDLPSTTTDPTAPEWPEPPASPQVYLT